MSISSTQFERLYIGDIRAVERLATWNPLQIRTVLSVSTDPIRSKIKEFLYVQIPILDAQPLPFEEELEERLKVKEKYRKID